MGDVTLEPPSEDDEGEDCDEEEDEDWVWHSGGARLTKRCNSQVRVRGSSAHACRCSQLTGALWFCQSNRQDVSSRTLVSHPSDKALSRYENKINLGNP